MSSLASLERIEATAGHDDDLMHVTCEVCRRQFCTGDLDLSDLLPAGEYPNDCIVCDDLDESCTHCPHCGAP